MTLSLQELMTARRAPQDTGLRLHLGCGEALFDGYVNIDFPRAQHNVMAPRPDLEADVLALDIPDGCIDEIRSHHMFEHFSRVHALGLLIRWRDWLKPDGELVIETPDFVANARAALESPPKVAMGLLRHLEGDQAAAWGYHLVHWFPQRFERTLSALGYTDLRFTLSDTAAYHRPALFNVTVRARKGAARAASDLRRAAEELLWDFTVSDVERKTWEVWCAQLVEFLDENPSAPASS